ncbi:hypothetical protein VTI74DRAFT_11307 [Chaetomium olivicolor]
MRPSVWAPAVMALAATAQVPTFEIDIVSPLNESYKDAEVLPIVVAVQNLTALRALSNFSILWNIMGFRDGSIPVGWAHVMGWFKIPQPSPADDGTILLVDYTNTTEWIRSKDDPDWRFALQWYVQSPEHEKRCGRGSVNAHSTRQMFNVVPDFERKFYGFEGALRDPVVTTECPDFGGVIEVRPNATNPDCSVVDLIKDRQGKPCDVKLDQAAVTSIASRVSSMAAPTPTTSTETTSTSTGGAGPARVIQTALAAACLLGGLAV